MSFDSLLNQTCSSTRATTAGQGASGRQKTTPTAVLTNEPCRLQSLTATELIGDRTTAVEKLVLFLRRSADISADDQVTVNGQVYEVKYPRDGGGALHHWECDVKLVSA